jgi:hypothetical protein
MLSRRAFVTGLPAALAAAPRLPLSREEEAFLEDLSHRCFQFFWEQADENTGLVRDRALADLGDPDRRTIASSAATGFGLTAICAAAERGWIPRDQARRRAEATLRFYAEKSSHEHGWFYHFVEAATGERRWNCEISSIDTVLLLAGVLTARQYFSGDAEIGGMARKIRERIDFDWMLNGSPNLLAMGWHPESGFIKSRWDHHCELGILYLLGIASPANPLPAESWYAWTRPTVTYGEYSYISGAPPLFVHQYSQGWIDFRGRREKRPPGTDWFENSVKATRAHRQFCMDLHDKFPGYSANVWGITASDSAKGYVAWGGPPATSNIDGSVVPCAAGGSLMFAPDICLPALMEMRRQFGDRIYKRYGFVDAFHPINGWTNPDVIGIDVGITLIAAENLRTGNVWRWFGKNPEVRRAMGRLFEAKNI